LEFETVIPFQFDGFARLEHSTNFFMVENGKFKLYDTKTNQPIADMQFDQVGWEKYGWIWFKKDNEYGLMAMKTEKITPQKTIESKFSLKWETPIGQTTYRTNIMFANAQIVVGSNGSERKKKDSKDRIYLIDPKNGKINQRIQPTPTGKTDVNGQAVSSNKLFFTNENGEAFCYDFSGKQIWSASIKDKFKGDSYYYTEDKIGEFENSPALADMNGDGTEDVVFTSEADQIYVLNGENGKRIPLPKFKREESYSFLATPVIYDISGDGTPNILTGGRWNNLMAFDGKTGELIWEREEHYSMLASATILLKKNELPKVLIASRSNRIDFADLKTGKTEKRIIYDDYALFATPMITPSKTLVLGTSEPRSEGVLQTFQLTKESWDKDEKIKDILFNSKDKAKATQKSNRISSSGFVADVLGNGEFQIGMVSEWGEFSLANEQGEIVQQFRLPAGVEAPIFVGDIDADGKLEIVFACLDGMLRCYETDSKGKVWWGQFHGDNKNSGVMDLGSE
jgi:outer membrane protein assembly factor BamB